MSPASRRVRGRALVLVRSAVPSRPVGAAASPAGRRLAHRLPARLGRGPRATENASPSASLPRVAALLAHRRRSTDVDVHARMGERLHVRVPADGALPPRPRAVRGRRGARRVAVRRARRELRRAGRRQPRVEAARSCSTVARPNALLDTYDDERIAAADENIAASTRATDFITPKSDVSRPVPRRGAAAREGPSVRAPARQQRAAVGAGHAASRRR